MRKQECVLRPPTSAGIKNSCTNACTRISAIDAGLGGVEAFNPGFGGRYGGLASDLLSLAFGLVLAYQIGVVGGLLTNHPQWTPR